MSAFITTFATSFRHRAWPTKPPPLPSLWRCTASRPPRITATPAAADTIHHALKRAPAEPGVYRFLDAQGGVLYVGKARALRSRLRQYVARDAASVAGVQPAAAVGPRIAAMLAEARAVDFIVTRSESAALALEASLVQELRPRYNVLLKDDRRHPYAMITFSEEYPRIVVTRSRKRRNVRDRMYGPFVDEGRLRQVLNCIHSVFPLRQRPRKLFPDRPCINYDLGRCPGVCQKLIAPEEYAKTIASVDKLLAGRVEEVLEELRGEMAVLSEALQYEKAAACRDRISMLEKVFFTDSFSGSTTTYDNMQSFMRESQDAASIVTLDSSVSRDMFSIARSESMGKVVLFQVRGGKVISRLVFSVAPQEGMSSPEAMLSAVLSSHYAGVHHAMEIPEEVVVSTAVADASMLRSVLSEKRGKAVSVRLPGPKTAPLARIVQHNADMELGLEAQRATATARDLADLSTLISPYFQHLIPTVNDEEVEPELGIESDLISPTSGESIVRPLQLGRIEGYDISHTSGSNAVGSMVVFLDGAPAPSEYRRYNLQDESSSQGHPDDYESLRETLRRRCRTFPIGSYSSALASSSLPDLLVIDGGKGQLSAAQEALEELGLTDTVAIISIAKGEEEIFVPHRSTCINYDRERQKVVMNDAVRLVCRVRDEAHRIAVRAHRKRRGRQALRSGLDSVAGLGAKKRADLLEHFNGSSEAVAQASLAELRKASGIGPALALRIHTHFRGAEHVAS